MTTRKEVTQTDRLGGRQARKTRGQTGHWLKDLIQNEKNTNKKTGTKRDKQTDRQAGRPN
jgi:hypothetical protein